MGMIIIERERGKERRSCIEALTNLARLMCESLGEHTLGAHGQTSKEAHDQLHRGLPYLPRSFNLCREYWGPLVQHGHSSTDIPLTRKKLPFLILQANEFG